MIWWVARTEPQRELLAWQLFADSGATAYCPVVKTQRRRSGRLVEAEVAMLPCYMFVGASAEAQGALNAGGLQRERAGRISLLRGPEGRPQVLNDGTIAMVREVEAEIAAMKPTERGALTVGQRVRLGDAGLEGSVLGFEGRKVRVGFSLLGAEREALVPRDHVGILETAVGA